MSRRKTTITTVHKLEPWQYLTSVVLQLPPDVRAFSFADHILIDLYHTVGLAPYIAARDILERRAKAKA